jgi:hypothetical protein
MPSTLNNQPQVVVTGKVDGGDHIGGVSDGDCVGAWFRCPTSKPAGGLRAAGLIPNKIGVFHLLNPCRTGRTPGRVPAWSKRRDHRDELSSNMLFQLFPTGGCWPGRVGRTNPVDARDCFGRARSNCLRQIGPDGRQERDRPRVLKKCSSLNACILWRTFGPNGKRESFILVGLLELPQSPGNVAE